MIKDSIEQIEKEDEAGFLFSKDIEKTLDSIDSNFL